MAGGLPIDNVREGWTQRVSCWLFFLLPWLYFLLYGFHGFADTDQGFVPALSWRIANGQWPYLDFYYVRPPLTPVLHSLEIALLPTSWELLGMRLVYYLMLWASCLWILRTFQRFPALSPGHPWLLGALGFVFAAHNFPAMPWHTVDGIFFSSLGTWAVTHPRSRLLMWLGMMALTVAALAKQPFALMAPMGLSVLLQLQGIRRAGLPVMGWFLAVVAMVVLLLSLAPAGFLDAMVVQVSGASGGGELFRTGVVAYFWPTCLLLLPMLVVDWLSRRWRVLGEGGAGWIVLGGIALVLFAHVGWAFWKDAFVSPRLGLYHALWLLGLWECWRLWRGGERPAAMALGLSLVIAWTSGVSWGYAVPVLMAMPGLLGLLGWVRRVTGRVPTAGWQWSLLVVGLLAFGGMQAFPYRDGHRWEMRAGGGELFPSLGWIRCSPETLAKLKEYSELRSIFPRATVLPGMPAADYLSRTVPLTRSDWEHDGEIGPQQLPQFLQDLECCSLFVFVEKSQKDQAHSGPEAYRCSALAEVLSDWQMLEDREFFQVFGVSELPGKTED